MVTHGENSEMESALHGAAWMDETSAISELIKWGADPNALDDHRWTPLHIAAFCGHIEAGKALIRTGAEPAVRTGDGRTPLELAEEREHREVAYTLSAAIVSSQDEEYRVLSALDRMTEMFISLMESGELPPWQRPWQDGRTMRPRNPYYGRQRVA